MEEERLASGGEAPLLGSRLLVASVVVGAVVLPASASRGCPTGGNRPLVVDP
jgi:hypothetical protein